MGDRPRHHLFTVTHPSIADWCNPAADVSDLVAAALTMDEIDGQLLFGAAGAVASPASRSEPLICMNEDCAQIYQAHPGECW